MFILIVNQVQQYKRKCISEQDILFFRRKFLELQLKIDKQNLIEFTGGNRNMLKSLSLNRIDTIDKITLNRNNISLFLLDKNRQTESNARSVTYNLEYMTLKYKIERVSTSGSRTLMKNYYVLVKIDTDYKKYAILLSNTEEANLKAFIAFANILSKNIDFDRLSDDDMKSLLKDICK